MGPHEKDGLNQDACPGEHPSPGRAPAANGAGETGANGNTGEANGRTEDLVYDQIVVGAGIIGLWVAHELDRAGQRVLLLDQFPRCHARGGSSGSSRAIELAFPNVEGIPLSVEAIEMYNALQKETGVDLIKNTNLIVFTEDTPREATPLPGLLKVLNSVYHFGLKDMDGKELRENFPGMDFQDTDYAIYDNVTAKEILASKAIHALFKILEARGVKVADSALVKKVESVPDPHGLEGSPSLLEVTCKNKPLPFRGKSVILATGAWTSKIEILNSADEGSPTKLVKTPDVKAHLLAQIYFKTKPGLTCPNTGFIEWTWQDELLPMRGWGRPASNTHTDFDYMAGIGDFLVVEDASDLEYAKEFDGLLEKAKNYVRKRLPCLDVENPCYIERSMDHMAASNERAGRALEGVDDVYLAVEGTTFGMAPIYAKLLAEQILKKKAALPKHAAGQSTQFASKFHW